MTVRDKLGYGVWKKFTIGRVDSHFRQEIKTTEDAEDTEEN